MLTRLGGYLLREVALLYLLGVAAFCLLLSVDYLSVMAQFLLGQNATAGQVGMLLLYKLPWFLHMSLPISGVFAVLLATGRLARDSELKAAYALGVPPVRLIMPLLAFGLLAGTLALAVNGWVEPLAERRYTALVESFYSARPPTEYQTNVAFSLDGDLYFAGEIRTIEDDSGRARLSGVIILLADGTSVQAPRGIWDSSERVWLLEDAESSRPGAEPELVGEYRTDFVFAGDPGATLTRQELLTLSELAAQRRALAASGSEARRVEFAFHRRIADAFSAFCFVLIAAVLAVEVRERATAFGLTIGLILAFYALWTVSATLFDRAVLTPAGAAWLTPVLVIAASCVLAVRRLSR